MSYKDVDGAAPELAAHLRALAKAFPREAPPELEAALVAEFRKRNLPRAAAGSTRWRWILAAAACLVLATGVARLARRAPARPAAVVAARPPARVAEPRVQPAPKPAAAKRTGRKRATPARLAPKPAEAPPGPPEIATEFFPVSYAAAPAEYGTVVRVRLPRSALTSFGLPVNVERAAEPVKADVLLGEDGIARAIRFVR